jgi:hypothetical protein
MAFSLIGRVKAESVIPGSAAVRISVSNPMRLIDGLLSHESLNEISSVPELASFVPTVTSLKENPVMKNRLVRLAARGNIELAMLPSDGDSFSTLLAVWDMKLLSPLLRILPTFYSILDIPNLYYVQAGKRSRFEYRTPETTLYIGPYRNLLYITNNSSLYESRTHKQEQAAVSYNNIKPSDYDAALLVSPDYIGSLLSNQDPEIAAVIKNIEIDSVVEVGLSIHEKKLEFRITAPLSTRQSALDRLIDQKSQATGMAERLPSGTQYATILSAGTLEELFQAAIVFSGPVLEDTYKMADSSSRAILGISLNELLFSWSGNEFAAFGLEGRPHPVYAIQIVDERRRQAVFDRAFKSIALTENVRLNLDGVRIPRIEVPEFLQSLLRRWNLYLPSPYYLIYKDYLLVSESAETLLSASRAMQRNDVLTKTPIWRNIAGGKPAVSAFSLYYTLDLSVPFFLRKNTTLSSFFTLYRQGLVRMSFNRGLTDISMVLVPGSGSGVKLISSIPIDTRTRPSNRIYGAGDGKNNDVKIFISAGDTVLSVNLADNAIKDLSSPNQGPFYMIPADGVQVDKNEINAWVVNERGRVFLVNGDLETAQGFPVLAGLRLSAPPVSFNGKLYLCDEDGKVHTIDSTGAQTTWGTSFIAALRSPPSFLTITSGRQKTQTYAAVYPKSFFGEIWLLDADGKPLPNWPASISLEESNYNANSGIGFGSPLLFAHNNSVHAAFIDQAGNLFVFDENAAPVSLFPINLTGTFFLQPVYDGEYLWLISQEGTLYRIGLNCEVLYQSIPGFTVKEEGYLTVFDYDNDKVPEVFITGEGNALYAYTRGFRSLEGFPLPMWGKAHFIEAQGNRKAGIVGMGMDRKLYYWQFR